MENTKTLNCLRVLAKNASPTILRNNLALAVFYFLLGYIGISLAVPPGYATIIWPAAGLALCAQLASGGRLWLGVWFGSAAFSVTRSFENSAFTEQYFTNILVASVVGLGACMQAVVGFWMSQRVSKTIEISNAKGVLLAILLVIVVPCFISPTFAIASLFLSDQVGENQILQNWATWFFGDLLGVTLLAPVLLLSKWSPIVVQWQGKALRGSSSLVAASLIATLLLTFYAWKFVAEREYEQAEENLAEMGATTTEALQHRLEVYERALKSSAAFLVVNRGTSPSEWREYTAQIDIKQSYPSMHGIGVFEEVLGEDMEAFSEQFAREYGNRFAIHPQANLEENFIVNRIEPLDTNLAALGLNLAFENRRREAINLSNESHAPILTRPIVLAQDAERGVGFLLVLPVRDETADIKSKWVYAPLLAREIFKELIPQQGSDFALQLIYQDSFARSSLIYAGSKVPTDPKFEFRDTISLAGQKFSIRLTSLPQFERQSESTGPILTIASGLTITALLGVLLSIFLRREKHVMQEVEQATSGLAEQNRMLELAEATAHIGHWHLSYGTGQIRWSDEVHRLHGLEPGDTPALAKAIEFYHPDDRSIVEQSLEAARITQKPYQFSARLITKLGKIRYVDVRGQAEVDASGTTTALIGVIIDRTDETLMQQRLTEKIEEARAADEAKSSFLANMSHEIRTPMNGVIGFSELALAQEKHPEQKRRLQMIADSGNAMLRILNDLLDFAKIEAKQMAIVNEQTDLRHTLRSCQRLMEPVATEKKIQVILEVDPKVPARIMIDKMRLRQIVLNLLGNALKFTDVGEVRVSASVSQRESDNVDMIFIVVSDTGIGIPPNRLASIFGKFTQADDTTARRYGGTGLGLPISAELAQLMGGTLRAKSQLGQGSTFILSFPLQQGDETNVSVPMPEEEVLSQKSGISLKILVAEDNPVNQELTIAMVEAAGHKCTLAQNGQQAVDAVLQAEQNGEAYDMVLMDMQMPEIDGLQASRKIREAGIGPEKLPILAVTANAYSDDIQRSADAGIQAHLAKPVRLKALSDAIAKWSPSTKISKYTSEKYKIDHRLLSKYENKRSIVINEIEKSLQAGSLDEESKETIAKLLHQIAGVAGYFGDQPLGEFCRSSEKALLEASDHSKAIAMLSSVRQRLQQTG